ncbi:tyrosinase family protein [Algoriphagus chordae]|uniref:Tyrosinase n=1 Tax=Algoriphagus chordae TaxID=237019 RepID=A0A2W7R6E0_9BACT|nr:tyrosinase family protein [Algoriphagus chordae]PZX55701.1 tyrosinase [Algoriphagus chordae]
MNKSLRIRRSVRELEKEYEVGNTNALEKVLIAWQGIKALPPTNPHSFFMLGGFHGEPFRGAGWGNNTYWGGYCNHGNVLFPTWHRAYLVKLEEALQSIPGCEDVMQPYWDETCDESLKNGIPWSLTKDQIFFDGKLQDNPLKSFKFPQAIVDNINGDNPNYGKPAGYETVRYPLSGLVGTADDRAKSAQHNSRFSNFEERVRILNDNVTDWLTSSIMVNGKVIPTNTSKKFKDCLDSPNFTVFSNTTSAQEYNSILPENGKVITPLESPHNDIHLAVGGCEVPGYNRSPIPNANGDMGENDTAGLDPIFFFHHCNVDRIFWLWQQRHNSTDHLDIIAGYPGTNSVDSQGPTPGTAPNSWLDLDSPLDPFKISDVSGTNRPYNSKDLINIESQLGYTYSAGSLAEVLTSKALLVTENSPVVRISRINKAPVRGSFTVSAFANLNGKKVHLGTEAVLSRWSVMGCANCQTHLEVKAFFPTHGLLKSNEVDQNDIHVEIHGREGAMVSPMLMKTEGGNKMKFHLEIR